MLFDTHQLEVGTVELVLNYTHFISKKRLIFKVYQVFERPYKRKYIGLIFYKFHRLNFCISALCPELDVTDGQCKLKTSVACQG